MRLLTHNMLASNVKVRAFRSRSFAFRSLGGGDIARLRASPRARDRLPTSASFLTLLDPPASFSPPLRQGTTSGFPLRIEVLRKEAREAEFHAEFLVNTLGKIEWDAFVGAAREIGEDDESFLRAFHHALLEVHVQEGYLVCPDSGRRFPITKGIPNMLLNEDEV
jgi:multifunctional methyltransferase subunit TRM112